MLPTFKLSSTISSRTTLELMMSLMELKEKWPLCLIFLNFQKKPRQFTLYLQNVNHGILEIASIHKHLRKQLWSLLLGSMMVH